MCQIGGIDKHVHDSRESSFTPLTYFSFLLELIVCSTCVQNEVPTSRKIHEEGLIQPWVLFLWNTCSYASARLIWAKVQVDEDVEVSADYHACICTQMIFQIANSIISLASIFVSVFGGKKRKKTSPISPPHVQMPILINLEKLTCVPQLYQLSNLILHSHFQIPK